MAVNNISYTIYLLSTRTEESYITKMIPFFFFFCSVYIPTEKTKSEMVIFSTKVIVKVTMSFILMSLEREFVGMYIKYDVFISQG